MIGLGGIVSIGSLAIANLSDESPLREQYSTILCAFVADAIAFLFGSLVGNNTVMAGFSLVVLTLFIALVGGMTEPLPGVAA